MAPTVKVPADFGVQNLYISSQCNVTINLENEKTMRANSMILSCNSDVFLHMFSELGRSTVDAQDFSKASVVHFLESIYRGEVEVSFTKEMFREVCKLAIVFKVKWMQLQCFSFFKGLVGRFSCHSFEDMLWAYEEAKFAKHSLKNSSLMDIFFEKSNKDSAIGDLFIQPYLDTVNKVTLSEAVITELVCLGGSDQSVFMNLVKDRMIAQDLELDNISEFILRNIDLPHMRKTSSQLYDEIFDLILEKSENVTPKKWKEWRKINSSVQRNEYEASLLIVKKKSVTVSNIPHLFHDISGRKDSLKADVDELLHYASHTYTIENMYMLIDLVSVVLFSSESEKWDSSIKKNYLLTNLKKLQKMRGLGTVHPFFIHRLQHALPDDFRSAVLESSLVSTANSDFRSHEKYLLLHRFVNSASDYRIYYHDTKTKCDNRTQCGFILRVTPVVKDNDNSFNIELLTDPMDYPSDIHIHDDIIKPDNIYITIDEYGERRNTLLTSWMGKPKGVDYSTIWYRPFRFTNSGLWSGYSIQIDIWKVELVVYITKNLHSPTTQETESSTSETTTPSETSHQNQKRTSGPYFKV